MYNHAKKDIRKYFFFKKRENIIYDITPTRSVASPTITLTNYWFIGFFQPDKLDLFYWYILTFPGLSIMISVALYWSPCACLPMTMEFVHPGTHLGIFLHKIGSRNTVPPSMFLIVPFGLSHIFFSLNSAILEYRHRLAFKFLTSLHLLETFCKVSINIINLRVTRLILSSFS